jgi:para-nitrobenzyl esterase
MKNFKKVGTLLTILLLMFDFHAFSQTTPSPVVRIDGGLVEGTIENGIIIYKGIPFAAPPVGNLRWRQPKPVKNWEGLLKADTFAPACSQQPGVLTTGFAKYGFSEDCLYLNIWKSNEISDKKLPVMVWIFGGGFASGSASGDFTTGEKLAKKGVILVNVSYRIGVFGFLAHPDLTSESENHVSGNYGLLDQIAALKWVRKNIEAFGGDPDNVTIFGQSAGGISVSILAASPLAKGLFQRAICMSGGSFYPASLNRDPKYSIQLLKGAELYGVEFTKRMGVNSIDDLRKIEAEKFLSDPMSQIGGVLPNIDGYVINDDQYKLYKEGKYNDVSVIIGSTSDEGSIIAMLDKPSGFVEATNKRFGRLAAKVLSLYPNGTDDITNRSMADLSRDLTFGWPAYAWATLQTKTGSSSVYVYYFDQIQPTSMLTTLLKSNKAFHGSDCFYAFGSLKQYEPIIKTKYTDDDQRLSEIIINYWTNFAKHGNPNGKELPLWPVFQRGKPTVMYLNSDPKPGPYPNLEKIKVIDEYYSWRRDMVKKSK